MQTYQNMSSLMCTIVNLVLPIIIMFGLVYVTEFAFMSSKNSNITTDVPQNTGFLQENLELQPLKTEEVAYTIRLKEIEMLSVQVSVILMWILVIMSILSWLSNAFGFCWGF